MRSQRNLRIAFVDVSDVRDPHTWSGIPFHILHALRAEGHDVTAIGPLNRWARFAYIVQRLSFSKTLQTDRMPLALWSYARQMERALAGKRFDLILATSTIPIARLKTSVPIVVWVDAVFESMMGYYDYYTQSNLLIAHRQEEAAMSRASLIAYASDWAATSARKHYSRYEEKIRVVPFGANLLKTEQRRQRRRSDPARLLFVGVDWVRKGGPVALEATALLSRRGVPAVLEIVGCEPEEARNVPHAVVHGFLSKRKAGDVRKMRELFEGSQLFFLPTRAEAAGIVFAEACAFSLPIVASATGGVTTYVRDEQNGVVLPPDAEAADYAASIESILSDESRYQRLSAGAYQGYRDRLNWPAAIRELFRISEKVSDLRQPAL